MVYCPRCDTKIDEVDFYCRRCGLRLPTAPPPRREAKVRHECAYCGGTGRDPSFSVLAQDCPVCDGRGYNLTPGSWTPCETCAGTGRKSARNPIFNDVKRCPHCSGKGWAP